MAIPASEAPGGALAVLRLEAAEPRTVPIRTPSATVGQGPGSDVVLEDDSVSASHARLELRGGRWRLIDLDSRNGSRIDGTRVDAGSAGVQVADGATVQFGEVRAVFEVVTGAEPGSDAPAEAEPHQTRSGFRLPLWILLLLVLGIIVVGLLLFTSPPPGTVVPALPVVLSEVAHPPPPV